MALFRKGRTSSARRPRRARGLSELERMEERALLATLIVKSNADFDFYTLTLRQAIKQATADFINNQVTDTIKFNLPATTGTLDDVTIRIFSPLRVTVPMIIDGTSQAAFEGRSQVSGPQIIIDGRGIFQNEGFPGFTLPTGLDASDAADMIFGPPSQSVITNPPTNASVFAIAFVGVPGFVEGTTTAINPQDPAQANAQGANAAVIVRAAGNTFIDDWFGPTLAAFPRTQNFNGILFTGANAARNTVGGSAVGSMLPDSNPVVASANDGTGILLRAGAASNTFENTYVGTTPNGLASNSAWTNLRNGVEIAGSTRNIFGNAGGQFRSVVSGNGANGIFIHDSIAPGNTIGSASVGVDVAGSGSGAGLANKGDGILIDNAIGTVVVGSPQNFSPTVVSNNRGYGIHAIGRSLAPYQLSVIGVYVGTDATGAKVVVGGNGFGNASGGIFLDGVKGTPPTDPTAKPTFDGATIANGVIAGNGGDGVSLQHSSNVQLILNKIGTGTTASELGLGNGGAGVFSSDSLFTWIGDSTIDRLGRPVNLGNIIAGNRAEGVVIAGNGDVANLHDVVQANLIGLGTTFLLQTPYQANPNASYGILVTGATGNQIGLTGPNAPAYQFGNVVSGNGKDGIAIAAGSVSNTVFGNKVGTDPTGLRPIPNQGAGVLIAYSQVNIIGGEGLTPAQDQALLNVISGNTGPGVRIFGTDPSSDLGGSSTGNQVANNNIGTSFDGTSALPNGGDGVLLDNAPSNLVGGFDPRLGNLISGNIQNGIHALNAPSSVILDNKIGTDKSGTLARPNQINGVFLDGTSTAVVGLPGEGNLIAGNGGDGVLISSPRQRISAQMNIVAGNLIGTDISGSRALGNGENGVESIDGVNNMIGIVGDDPTVPSNVIAGNHQNGVSISTSVNSSSTRSGNTVTNDLIGVGSDGVTPVPNGIDGVLVFNSSGNHIGAPVGGPTHGPTVPTHPSNVIAAEVGAGIEVAGTSSNNFIQGNYLGLGFSAGHGQIAAALGNTADIFLNNTSNNQVGGSDPGAGNVIAGGNVSVRPNTTPVGVQIFGPSASGNSVLGNFIGTDETGTRRAGNTVGVFVNNAPGNRIGGASLASRNVISGNLETGVYVAGTGATTNRVTGNYIGTDLTGTRKLADDPANIQFAGVIVTDAAGTVIGAGSDSAHAGDPGNLISGNQLGIIVAGGTAAGTVIQKNQIGTNSSGTALVPNTMAGIFINNAPGSLIASNLISGNGLAGVYLFGGLSQGNAVAFNTIGTNAAGSPVFRAGAAGQDTGVLVIGASNNLISSNPQISGNRQTGVFISNIDANGVTYPVPMNNTVAANAIRSNGNYGVLRYNSPNNAVFQTGAQRNVFSGNPVNVRDFVTALDSRFPLPAPTGTGKAVAIRGTRAGASLQVPTLFPPGSQPNAAAARQRARRAAK